MTEMLFYEIDEKCYVESLKVYVEVVRVLRR